MTVIFRFSITLSWEQRGQRRSGRLLDVPVVFLLDGRFGSSFSIAEGIDSAELPTCYRESGKTESAM